MSLRSFLKVFLFLVLSCFAAPVFAQPNSNGIISYPKPDFKVVGGGLANPDDFPGFAALLIQHNGTWKVACGATFISSHYAVTAAHCFESDLDTQLITPDQVRSHFSGDIGKIKLVSGGGQNVSDKESVFSVRRIVIHPEYSSQKRKPYLENDIALIEVNAPFTDNVVSVSGLESTDPDRGIIYVIGQGKTSADNTESEKTIGSLEGWPVKAFNAVPMSAGIPFGSPEICSRLWGKTGFYSGSKQICAGYLLPQKADSCGNDSGGPLLANDKMNRSYLIGVLSYGPAICDSGKPAAYTRFSAYRDWINEVVGSSNIIYHENTPGQIRDVNKTIIEEFLSALTPVTTELSGVICKVRDINNKRCLPLDEAADAAFEFELRRDRLFANLIGREEARLVLLSLDANDDVIMLLPNFIDLAGDSGILKPGQDTAIGEGRGAVPFRLTAQEPLGASQLIGLLIPPEINLEYFGRSEVVEHGLKTNTKSIRIEYDDETDNNSVEFNDDTQYLSSLLFSFVAEADRKALDVSDWKYFNVDYKVVEGN